MRKSEAIAHYGNNVSALARALGIDQSSVYSWGDYPPDARQLQLERITGGDLQAEPECEANVLGIPLKRKGDRPKPKPPAKRKGGKDGRKTGRA